jgi:hypothetical protein
MNIPNTAIAPITMPPIAPPDIIGFGETDGGGVGVGVLVFVGGD